MVFFVLERRILFFISDLEIVNFYCLCRRILVKRDIMTSRRRSERIQSRSIDLSVDNVDDDPNRRRSSRLNAVSIISYNEGGDNSQSASLSDNSEVKEIDGRFEFEVYIDGVDKGHKN